jgi:hypothetical protein
VAVQIANGVIRAMRIGLCNVYYTKQHYLQTMMESDRRNVGSKGVARWQPGGSGSSFRAFLLYINKSIDFPFPFSLLFSFLTIEQES